MKVDCQKKKKKRLYKNVTYNTHITQQHHLAFFKDNPMINPLNKVGDTFQHIQCEATAVQNCLWFSFEE